MNLKSIFSYQNLFAFNTAYVSPQEKLMFLAGAVAFLLGIVLRISATLAPNPVDKKFRHNLYRVFMFFGISEIVWYLCRYENAPFFGTHFVAGLIFFISVIWLLILVWMFAKNYRSNKQEWDKEQLKLKYLPK